MFLLWDMRGGKTRIWLVQRIFGASTLGTIGRRENVMMKMWTKWSSTCSMERLVSIIIMVSIFWHVYVWLTQDIILIHSHFKEATMNKVNVDRKSTDSTSLHYLDSVNPISLLYWRFARLAAWWPGFESRWGQNFSWPYFGCGYFIRVIHTLSLSTDINSSTSSWCRLMKID